MNTRILTDFTPPNCDEAIAAHISAYERARKWLHTAQTEADANVARDFMASAESEIATWQARKAEAMRCMTCTT